MSTTADGTDADEQIQASIVTCDDGTEQCTLHPVDPDEPRRTTEWLTAEAGSFEPLDSRR